MTAYETFLASKRLIVPNRGVEVRPEELPIALFGFQRALVTWSLRKGRAALFASTGLGKTLCQLAWAERAAERTLVLAPLAVAQQTVREGEKFGIPATYCRRQGEAPAKGITVTNYEMLHHFDPDAFGAVVLDECFAAGTLVDTPGGPRPIEALRPNDLVWSALGKRRVLGTKQRRIKRIIILNVEDNSITCSPNHPWLTRSGWKRAIDIEKGDELVRTEAAMRVLRDRVSRSPRQKASTILRQGVLREVEIDALRSVLRGECSRAADLRMVRGSLRGGLAAAAQTFLRNVVLGQMADESAGIPGRSPYARGSREARATTAGMVCGGVAGRRGRASADRRTESDEQSGVAGEGFRNFASHGASSFDSGRQRPGTDPAPEAASRGAWRRLGDGIRRLVGTANGRVSDRLQGGHREFPAEGRRRSRWRQSSITEAPGGGREARRKTDLARVDGVAVYEQGDPDFYRYGGGGSEVTLYDLEVEGHPSFSVNGLLVHNSSCLKDHSSVYRQALTQAFRHTPMKLCASATPAPNDIAEIGTHAEFLGAMTRQEMIAHFFINRSAGKDLQLKRHGREAFWRWLASWGMTLNHPSDLGFDAPGYDLPPLTVEPVFVETDYRPKDRLFADRLAGVTERAAVRRETLPARVQAAVAIVKSEPDEQWLIWTGLIDESKAMTAALPDAVEVEGADSPEAKEERLIAFAEGRLRVLVTKREIAGHGLNLQTCARMVFVGLNDSWEGWYQCIRRCWRYGQTRPVKVWAVLSEPERVIWENVQRKEQEAAVMSRELVRHVAEFEKNELAAAEATRRYAGSAAPWLPVWLRGEDECRS